MKKGRNNTKKNAGGCNREEKSACLTEPVITSWLMGACRWADSIFLTCSHAAQSGKRQRGQSLATRELASIGLRNCAEHSANLNPLMKRVQAVSSAPLRPHPGCTKGLWQSADYGWLPYASFRRASFASVQTNKPSPIPDTDQELPCVEDAKAAFRHEARAPGVPTICAQARPQVTLLVSLNKLWRKKKLGLSGLKKKRNSMSGWRKTSLLWVLKRQCDLLFPVETGCGHMLELGD